MIEIKKLLKEYARDTNEVLEEIMDSAETNSISETLLNSMKYSLFSGGKRLRPILTTMVSEMAAGEKEVSMRAGAAIELIHTYSLIHDDLPSMDDDDYRRGRKTNHKVYGPGIAILAGDALLTYAFNIISHLELSPEKKVKIIEIVSQGAGYTGMVGGQVLDLEAENRELDLKSLQKIHLAKTGALFKASILTGAYCGNPTEMEIKALKIFSGELGLTFQIVDDILDVTGDQEKLGKSVGRDEALNKATYPRLLGLDGAKSAAGEAAERAKKSLDLFGKRADKLKALIDFILFRES